MLPLGRQIIIGWLSGDADGFLNRLFVCLAAAALNAVFAKLGQKAGPSWNISGDPCTGTATDDTNIDNSVVFKAAIKCEFCTGGNTSICRITRL